MSNPFFIKLMMVLLVTLSAYSKENTEVSLTHGLHAKAQAERLADEARFVEAAQTYEKAADVGLNRSHALWKAVNFYVKAEQPVLALPALEKLADLGNGQYPYFESLAPHFTDQYNERFQAILAQVKQNSVAENEHVQSASQIIVDDVGHFFAAFDQAKDKPLAQQIQIYEKLYFDRASPGMVDYASFKIKSIKAFVEHVERSRPYYADVKKATAKLQSLKPKVIEAMEAMRAYVPDAQPPNIYFIVGMHTSGGTASENGLLLGADFIVDSKQHFDFIPDWTHPFVSSAEDKLWTIMHEYVHFLQNTSHETVLGNALVEGGADFIANLLYGKPNKTSLYTYGLQHEARIKKRFLEKLNSTDLSLWTGNNGTKFDEDWVPDLGYFIGHQIAQGYYQQAQDKKQAIIDLLEIKDPENILKLSRYASIE